jgi:hypothetical protein
MGTGTPQTVFDRTVTTLVEKIVDGGNLIYDEGVPRNVRENGALIVVNCPGSTVLFLCYVLPGAANLLPLYYDMSSRTVKKTPSLVPGATFTWLNASITSAAEEHNTGSRMLKIVGTYSGGAFTPTSAYATKKELLPTP